MQKFIKMQQHFPSLALDNVEDAVSRELSKASVPAGAKIGIAVGSRGISNLYTVVKTVVEHVKRCGAKPFIIPAMGSHGGASPEGQTKVLAELGIDEVSLGVPVKASMEVAELSSPGLENRVFSAREALNADGIFLINRVKPHTSFHGEIESGLLKMITIGLGKQRGAEEIHRRGIRGLTTLIKPTALRIMQDLPVMLGIALVEDAYDETMIVQGLLPEKIAAKEPQLLQTAKANMPSLPLDDIDVLIVDRIGKNISGTGIDPNIIGRLMIDGATEPDSPRIKKLVLCDLTPESCGNAIGVGFGDFITRRLFEKIDLEATYTNVMTTTFTNRAKIPIIASNALQAYTYALRSLGTVLEEEGVVIRIRDTLCVNELFLSPAAFAACKSLQNAAPKGTFQEIFDADGELKGFS